MKDLYSVFQKFKINIILIRKKKSLNLNHLNSDQMATFLYFFSNSCYKNSLDKTICDKIYFLNKILNSIDIYYEVSLPNVFLLIHPVGTVLGRANYSDYLIVYQGVNVGSNKNIYPTFSKYVTLRPSSSVLGKSRMGTNSELATGSILIDHNVEKKIRFILEILKKISLKKKNNINEVWKK